MKKIVILVIGLFLLTGCSSKYNLIINEDLSVIEEASLTGTESFFSNYYKSTKTNVLKSFIDIYKDILDENSYTYELISGDKPYVLVKNKYDSVNSYINKSILFNGYFDEVKYTEDGNIKKIETIGFNDNNPDDPERFTVKELTITIKCPFKVINHNAKNVDKKTNTYYYELSKENDKIMLEYDTSGKFNPNADLIKTLLIMFLIVIVAWIVIIIVNKNNNKQKNMI